MILSLLSLQAKSVGIAAPFCTLAGHHFWTEDITIRDILDVDSIITHAQITDIYLLGLAIYKGGKLASLDQHLPTHAVQDGRAAFELITS